MTARVLVVDDIAPNARLLEARLVQEYYDVKMVTDSREAVEVARVWQPDVILLDVLMPTMSGYEVCNALKDGVATAHIPVIMITGLERPAERAKGLRSGADEFLTRPVDYDLLLARLRGILRLKRLMDEWRLRGAAATALGLRVAQPSDVPHGLARVLIADDLAARTAAIGACLRDAGVLVSVASDEADLLAQTTEDRFDLILISLSLLDGDPLRLVARCRARAETRDTPLLLIAEQDERDLMIAALDLGANDCLVLPLDPDELLLRVNNQIKRKFYEDTLRDDVGSALRLAVIDPLTQLYNRRYLESHLQRLCEESSIGGFGLFMIDLDHFKAINDHHGHAVGDKTLRGVADILRQNLRPSDLIVRYGGEEFVVVIAGLSDEAAASVIAEKIRVTIEGMIVERTIRVTASIGLTIGDAEAVRVGDAADSLLARADFALYEAKRAGRNRVVAFGEVSGRIISFESGARS
ncbi:PleD family two-component system response regulator [Acidiphilium sp. PA]|uniref:PleD family two-component system response regulator n=1 Tax=Acidiphilium sp. PA TaxID=2871705 RepID=UPI002242EA54|nr:PleD family two-component system response regulator [Acidiphilium sp. PA]MCW8306603.1 PleD family two-component system response regulator [Acidiphilium sp. PA]